MDEHPFSRVFPVMDEVDLRELADDIRANGLREKIIVLDGLVLDGRNRLSACQLANVAPVFEDFIGDDPIGFVMSRNYYRRHLTTSQRAAAAVEYATLASGEKTKSANLHLCTGGQLAAIPIKQAAATFKVSARVVKSARKVKAANPHLFEQIKSGKRTVHAAEKEVDAKKRDRRRPTQKKDALLDAEGVAVPSHLRDVFGDTWLDELAAIVDEIRCRINSPTVCSALKGKSQAYGAYLRAGEMVQKLTDVDDTLEEIESGIRSGKPYAVHLKCDGTGCEDCRKTGWVPKWRFDELQSEAAR
jgi:hypothetical protein